MVPLYHSDGLVVYCPSFSVSLFFMNIHFLDVLYNLAFFCTFMYTVVYFVLSIKKKKKKNEVCACGGRVFQHNVTRRTGAAQLSRSSVARIPWTLPVPEFNELDIYLFIFIFCG